MDCTRQNKKTMKLEKWITAIPYKTNYFHKLLSKLLAQEPNCWYGCDDKLIVISDCDAIDKSDEN